MPNKIAASKEKNKTYLLPSLGIYNGVDEIKLCAEIDYSLKNNEILLFANEICLYSLISVLYSKSMHSSVKGLNSYTYFIFWTLCLDKLALMPYIPHICRNDCRNAISI